jgi:hypothetical protein
MCFVEKALVWGPTRAVPYEMESKEIQRVNYFGLAGRGAGERRMAGLPSACLQILLQ